ncbi:hypothetical protein [Streptomyces sp. NPDC002845]
MTTIPAEDSGAHPRFAEALRELGLNELHGRIRRFPEATRTAAADRSLLGHDTVWAAAGTPYTVFPMAPKSLVAHARAALVDVREQTA